MAAVLAVRPSGPDVPANLLRLSIVFDHPTSGPVLPRLALVRDGGTLIKAPFLEQELWSPDGRTLTVLLHPGRVKTGLVAHDTVGAVLAAGETVALALDGKPLRRWTVGPDSAAGPDPTAWRLTLPPGHSRRPLTVRLDGAIDALDADLIAVATASGRRVAGTVRLDSGERTWRFTPTRPWTPGRYRLLVNPELEDPAGDRVGQRFEEPADALEAPPPAISFDVR